jgi:hypothetical protein
MGVIGSPSLSKVSGRGTPKCNCVHFVFWKGSTSRVHQTFWMEMRFCRVCALIDWPCHFQEILVIGVG